jgi:hypothetical protein
MLGLVVYELSDDSMTRGPWRGRVLTFSERPQLNWITVDTLVEKVAFVRAMDWGRQCSTRSVRSPWTPTSRQPEWCGVCWCLVTWSLTWCAHKVFDEMSKEIAGIARTTQQWPCDLEGIRCRD